MLQNIVAELYRTDEVDQHRLDYLFARLLGQMFRPKNASTQQKPVADRNSIAAPSPYRLGLRQQFPEFLDDLGAVAGDSQDQAASAAATA